ncbi:MAG: hypothetical protein IPI48_16055 [bacterium]|nr:hypothetical protein [bacterium]
MTATGNRIVRCPTGIFVDTSPIQISHVNRFTGNAFEFCDTGVLFHSSEKRNEFVDNAFHGCAASVRVDGHGDATHVTWRGNYFEDYAGFDLDGDGTGDVPHSPAPVRPADEHARGVPLLSRHAGPRPAGRGQPCVAGPDAGRGVQRPSAAPAPSPVPGGRSWTLSCET